MADVLSAKEWKTALKQQRTDKDAGLADALDLYAKVRGKDAAKESKALDELAAKASAAGKLLKSNKELARHADAIFVKVKAESRQVKQRIAAGEEETGGRDTELFTALKRAKSQPMFFALVVRSASEGRLLLSRMKVKPTDVAAAKKSLGGGRVFRGVCVAKEGEHHFLMKQQPPAVLPKLIKRLAKEQAKLMIKPVCLVQGDRGGKEAETVDKG